MQKNIAGQKWRVFAFDRTTQIPKTGDEANITAVISIDGEAAGATNDVNPTELSGGFYEFSLTQAETNGSELLIIASSTTASIQVVGAPATITTTPVAWPTDVVQTGDSFARIGNAGASLTNLGDTRIANLDALISSRLAPTDSGRTLDVNLAGQAGIDWANVGNPATVLNLSATTISSVSSLGTNAIDANSIATDAVNKIVDATWEEVIADHTGISGGAAITLYNASSADDPWSTSLPGAYGSGTAGKIIGDNINATIDSRMASYTQPDGFLTATFPTYVAESGGSAGLDASGIRDAIGMASANLDSQLSNIPNITAFEARTLPSGDYFNATTDTVANVAYVVALSGYSGGDSTTMYNNVVSIKSVTDQMVFSTAGQIDAQAINVSSTGIRDAIGLASANLDTQLGDIPTVSEFNARTLDSGDYFNPSTQGVTLADNVAHGGPSATFELGSSGSDPTFKITNIHPDGQGMRISANGVNANALSIYSTNAAGISVYGGSVDIIGTLQASNFNNDSITSTALADSAVNEIRDAIIAELGVSSGDITSIKTKTDQMVFTNPNQLDVTVNSVTQSGFEDIFETFQITESYPATGVAPTPAQGILMSQQAFTNFNVVGTTISVLGLDGTTVIGTWTIDNSGAPTSRVRAT